MFLIRCEIFGSLRSPSADESHQKHESLCCEDLRPSGSMCDKMQYRSRRFSPHVELDVRFQLLPTVCLPINRFPVAG